MRKKNKTVAIPQFYIWVALIIIGIVIYAFISSGNNSSVNTPVNYNQDTSSQDQSSQNGDAQPFWSGTSTLQICKKPYYDSSECQILTTKLLGGGRVQIFDNNGNSVIASDLACYKGGNPYDDMEDYVFCRSYDSEGGQWDIFPTWVNL